jgi:hypothetical protein
VGARGRPRQHTLVQSVGPPTRDRIYGTTGGKARPLWGRLFELQVLVDSIKAYAEERELAANVLEAAHRSPEVRRVLVQMLRAQLARVKRCPNCDRWFVDITSNIAMQRCSAWCTNRWWDRARRRKAGHRR